MAMSPVVDDIKVGSCERERSRGEMRRGGERSPVLSLMELIRVPEKYLALSQGRDPSKPKELLLGSS